MAKKELTLQDLFTKLTTVFPTDMIIVNSSAVIEGPKSFDRNDGHYACSLNQDSIDVIKNAFGKKRIIYVSDIKKAKTHLDKYVSYDCNEERLAYVKTVMDKYLIKCQELEDWNHVELSEEKLELLFLGEEIDLYFTGGYQATASISKSLLPLVAKNTFPELIYTIRKVIIDGPDILLKAPEPKMYLEEKPDPGVEISTELEDITKMELADVIFSFHHEYFDVYMTISYLLW